MTPRERGIGLALVVISACGFGSGALFAKPIYGAGVDWLTLLAWRFLFAALVSWAWLLAWPAHRLALRRLSRRAVLVLMLLGLLYMGNSGTYFAGLETVPASLAALIVYLYPALVAVMSIRFARRLEGRRAWGALALASAGVALAVGGIEPGAAPPMSGLLLIVASPIIYAIWIIMAARLGGERARATDERAAVPPYDSETTPEPEQTPPASAAAIMVTATAVGWWIAAVASGRPVHPADIPAEAWLPLLGVGIVATALAIQAFYAGARRIGAAQASLASTVEPVYTIGLATVLFGERLGPVQVVGGILVIVGVVIAQSGELRRASHRLAAVDPTT
ncbi:MAG TPA: DMT family transporter [Candidatus Caenarcaniphilales bacterium]|nr:DMT family transporter [Candidatus Caenarcaniphilales bacterium]